MPTNLTKSVHISKRRVVMSAWSTNNFYSGHCESSIACPSVVAYTILSAWNSLSSTRSPFSRLISTGPQDSMFFPSVNLPPPKLLLHCADPYLCLLHWAALLCEDGDHMSHLTLILQCLAVCLAHHRCSMSVWISEHNAVHCTEGKRYSGCSRYNHGWKQQKHTSRASKEAIKTVIGFLTKYCLNKNSYHNGGMRPNQAKSPIRMKTPFQEDECQDWCPNPAPQVSCEVLVSAWAFCIHRLVPVEPLCLREADFLPANHEAKSELERLMII